MAVDVTVQKVKTGGQLNTPGAPCVGGRYPAMVNIREVILGTEHTVWVCILPNAAPCDPGGLLSELYTAGYRTPDNPCGYPAPTRAVKPAPESA